jgi:hypothetical protein
MTAKDFLLQIRKLDKLIENKMAEAQQWREIANNTSVDMSRERVQSSGSYDVTANAICKSMDLENEAELFKWEKENIIKQIEKLDAVYYDVLHKIYVQGIPIKSIAAQYHKRCEWASRMHTKALEAFEKLINNG